ncbi:hypothetical protein [Kitasatospora sp. NE20-6]|uniref:hypothetical protein n=1 Tax=Kitasatospora sp. NE20-6 TaxID=2859066 RepID=UPI0038B3E443
MPARNRRLPRHLSWPLTPTDIRTALGDRLAEVDEVHFDDRPWDDGTLLHVAFTPVVPSNHGNGIHPDRWLRIQVSVAPLPAADRAAARHVLQQHALAELRAWIDGARRAPEAWTLTRHSRSWCLAGSSAAHRDDGRPYR